MEEKLEIELDDYLIQKLKEQQELLQIAQDAIDKANAIAMILDKIIYKNG